MMDVDAESGNEEMDTVPEEEDKNLNCEMPLSSDAEATSGNIKMEEDVSVEEEDVKGRNDDEMEQDNEINDNEDNMIIPTSQNSQLTSFNTLPIQLYNEIFKFLDLGERNKIRRVSRAWDRAIKYGFGVRVIIDNNNLTDITTADDVLEAQIRNLTLQIPPTTKFKYEQGIRILDICGIIYSKNLIRILTTFSNLLELKLSRVYLETDNRIDITQEERLKLPSQLENVSMRFLKTIHKTPGGFELGRNSELFGLTSSDYLVLSLLNEFQFPNLTTLELYHDMTEEVRSIRNSEMIERNRNGSVEHVNSGTESSARILAKILEIGPSTSNSSSTLISTSTLTSNSSKNSDLPRTMKKLHLDNLPIFSVVNPSQSNTTIGITNANASASATSSSNSTASGFVEKWGQTQWQHLQIDGVLPGDWSSLIREQNQLQTLDLVILHPSLIDTVKTAVTNSAATIKSISLVACTPNDMVIQGPVPGGHGHLHDWVDDVPQNPNIIQIQGPDLPPPPPPPPPPQQQQQNFQNQNQFHHLQHIDDTLDLIFLFQCQKLTHLKIHWAPKILDVTFLPASIETLEICGNVPLDGLLQFISGVRYPTASTSPCDLSRSSSRSTSSRLRRLVLEICAGPVTRDLPPEHPITFDLNVIKQLIRESRITELVISEAGASDEFEVLAHEFETNNNNNHSKNSDEMEDKAKCFKDEGVNCGIRAKLDFLNYKVTQAEGGFGRRQISCVPRISIKIPKDFDRSCVI